ncbi:MAG TPA: hypothetical protein VGK90_02770 [Rhizomicrobium sp.]
MLDLCNRVDIFLDAAKQFHAEVHMRHLATAEAQSHLHLVAFIEETAHRPHFHVIVVIVDRRAHLDLLDLDDLLLLARLGGFFLLFVFEFPVVHEFGHGRGSFRRNFDEIEPLFFRDGAGFVGSDLTIFVPVCSDEQEAACVNLLIHAWPVLGRSRGG